MRQIAAVIFLIFSGYVFWLSPAFTRRYVLMGLSLVIGSLVWPQGLVVAILLTLFLSLPRKILSKVPLWFSVAFLFSPVVYRKIVQVGGFGLEDVSGVSYFCFLAAALFLDERKEDLSLGVIDRFQFVSFFPLAAVGPIERIKNLKDQFLSAREFNFSYFLSGLTLVAFGIFKKTVIVGRLAVLGDDIGKQYASYSGIIMWLYMALCFVWIYCDFSAAIDIVRGVSRIFGIEVMDNFDRPYLSTSVQDIWHRWHISLVSWLREKVYTPIALKTRSVILASGLLLFLVGLWHGLGWQFVLWAVYWMLPFWAAVLLRKRGTRLRLPLAVKVVWANILMIFSTAFLVPRNLDDLREILAASLLWRTPVQAASLPISDIDLLVILIGTGIVVCFEVFLMSPLFLKYRQNEKFFQKKAVPVSRYLLTISAIVFLTIVFGVSRWDGFIYMKN